ncbi:MAG: hypothetical protein MUO88_24060, partial [Desulfobacterales bacterium]|nr:hypothetical protein [Desulfobacterales bacterium]
MVLIYEEHLKPVAEEAARLYPGLKADLEKTFRWRVDFIPTVMLVQDNNLFQEMAGSKLIAAFALPGRDLMVIDYSKMKTDPFSLEATMKHELCHLLLHK